MVEKLEYRHVRFGERRDGNTRSFSDAILLSASLPKLRKSLESERV